MTTFGSDFARAPSRFRKARRDARARSAGSAIARGSARDDRRVEADLVAHIGEVDERRLYARKAFPSMFAYCTEELHLSEAEAYRRITVARAARQHAVLLAMLRDGRLHLSGIAMLAPLLTPDNRNTVLARATHRSKRQIEELVAELAPRPDAPSVIRKLPQQRKAPLLPAARRDQALPSGTAPELVPGRVGAEAEAPSSTLPPPAALVPPAAFTPAHAPSRPAVVEPLSPARYKVQFTASAELRDKLERLTALMRPEVPDGDLAAVIERAVSDTLERLEARRYARTRAPRRTLGETHTAPASRHIPAAVRRAVRERDGDRCRYVDAEGRRCSARDRLEFHHRHPFGMGGDYSLANIQLACRSHNRYLAEQDYGRAVHPTAPSTGKGSARLSGSALRSKRPRRKCRRSRRSGWREGLARAPTASSNATRTMQRDLDR